MISRLHGFPDDLEEPFWLFPDDSTLKAHPHYKAAKAGEMNAAVHLVADLALPLLLDQKIQFPHGACFVAPHAREAAGDNAIPQVLATTASIIAGGETVVDIVQIDQVYHTRVSAFPFHNSSFILHNFPYPDMALKSTKPSASPQPPSPPTKPIISSDSARLTRSEIDSLRRGKKRIADFTRKELIARIQAALKGE